MSCSKEGKRICANCKLVAYCERVCQTAHWPEHKAACKSPLSKPAWRPSWDVEGRIPHWASPQASQNWHNTFGGEKYLWGNTPALDVLALERNEGLEHHKDLAILFAASGDIRHLVQTIAALPLEMRSRRVNITLNDWEPHITARNTVLLLLALTQMENGCSTAVIANTLMHVWYSAFLTEEIVSKLRQSVKPLIEEACNELKTITFNTVLVKTWQFRGGNKVRVELPKEAWLHLRNLLDTPKGLTYEKAVQLRRSVTLAPERKDYRDRWHFKELSPHKRVAKELFQEDGLLLAFGVSRKEFTAPNPTLFLPNKGWPMDDKADPSDGWPSKEVQRTNWLMSEDWYGRLSSYIHTKLERFVSRLGTCSFFFDIYCMDARKLQDHLPKNYYNRVEVSNICDAGYIGVHRVLAVFCPLLQNPQENKHARIVTLFMNAVIEVIKMGKEEAPNIQLLLNYLPSPQISVPFSANSAELLRVWDARNLVLDVNKYFARYMKLHKFEQISADLRVTMDNTICEEWPTQLKLRIGEDGFKEEFRLMLGSGFTNMERYVVWRKL